MPIPVPSSILLTFASVALLGSQWSRVKDNRYWFVAVLAALVLAATALAMTSFSSAISTDLLSQRTIWTNDPLAVCEQWLIVCFGLLTAVSIFDAQDSERQSIARCGYLLFTLAGLLLVAQANDLISLGLSLEVIRLALSGLESDAGNRHDPIGRLSASSFYWIDRLSSGLIWLGVALLANVTAATQLDAIAAVLATTYESVADSIIAVSPSRQLRLAVCMIVLGLLSQCGSVPFQTIRYRLKRRNDWRRAFIVMVGPLAGSIALTRLLGMTFVGLGQSLAVFLLAISLATLAFSAMLALRCLSPGMKSMALMISSLMLLQAGWLAVGLMTVTMELAHHISRWGAFAGQSESLAVVVFSQLSFVLIGCGLLNGLAHLSRLDRDVEFLEDLKGLSRYSPWTAVALAITLISALGGPLTIGFWSHWWMMAAGCNVHVRSSASEFAPYGGVRFLMLAALATTVVVGIVVIRVAREMYLEAPLAQPAAVGGRGTFMTSVIASTACLLLGLFPQTAMKPLSIVRAPRPQPVPTNHRGSGSNAVGTALLKSTVENTGDN